MAAPFRHEVKIGPLVLSASLKLGVWSFGLNVGHVSRLCFRAFLDIGPAQFAGILYYRRGR